MVPTVARSDGIIRIPIIQPKDKIEELIQAGHLRRYVRGGRTTWRSPCREEAPRKRDRTGRRRMILAENAVKGGTTLQVDTWMSSIIQYLEHGTCKPGNEKAIRLQCARYTMIGQDLYRRGYSIPLLKCLTKEQTQYVLQEIHDGACDNHSGAKTMATKVIRARYYWSTVQGDCAEYVKKCLKC